MSEQKQYKTEWSFSFDKLGDSFKNLFDSLSGDEEAKMASFSEPVNAATQGTIDLDFSVGVTTLKALVASDNLIEADVTYVGEIEFATSGAAERRVKMRQKAGKNVITDSVKRAFGTIANRQDLRWDIRLSPDVPLKLDLDAGVGLVQADFTGLNLSRLEYDGGVGKTEMILPASTDGYQAKIDGGVGEVHITLPAETTATVKIEGGVGAIKLMLPANAAVRFHVESGLGSVHMPKHLIQTASKNEIIEKSGVWETPGFDQAAHKMTVHYEGGIGSFHVQSDVTMV
ncbi:MAG: hypothetical protein OHK0046_49460 [Anaerolineae bacterium]